MDSIKQQQNHTAQQPTADNMPVIRQLGITPYEESWSAMKEFVAQRDASTPDEIWLLQHPPVFTQGLAGKAEHILSTGSIPIVKSDRGGQITYHGPGQLIAYLMIDTVRREWHSRDLVDRIEGSLINLLAEFDIPAHRLADAPGVYTEDGRKIASLGLRIKRKSSYHGLALNVDMDLKPFSQINPCGYSEMKMSQMIDFQAGITMKEVNSALIRHLTTQLSS